MMNVHVFVICFVLCSIIAYGDAGLTTRSVLAMPRFKKCNHEATFFLKWFCKDQTFKFPFAAISSHRKYQEYCACAILSYHPLRSETLNSKCIIRIFSNDACWPINCMSRHQILAPAAKETAQESSQIRDGILTAPFQNVWCCCAINRSYMARDSALEAAAPNFSVGRE